MRKVFFGFPAVLRSALLMSGVHAQSISGWLGYVQNLLQSQVKGEWFLEETHWV
jgi:hypothetical protein